MVLPISVGLSLLVQQDPYGLVVVIKPVLGTFSFGPRTVLAASVTTSLNWFHFSSGPTVSGPIASNLSSGLNWNSGWYLPERSLAVLKAYLMSFGCLWCCGTMRMLSLTLMSLWSVQHSTPRITLVLTTSLLSRWRVIIWSVRCHCFERGCVHDVLYLSASRKMVLVISRFCAAHLLSNRRRLLSIFPTPCFPVSLPVL